jgi:hypothetical protein
VLHCARPSEEMPFPIFSYGNSLPTTSASSKSCVQTTARAGWSIHPPPIGGNKMRQPPRHIDDPLTSLIALLISAVVGLLGLLVLMLTLALGL